VYQGMALNADERDSLTDACRGLQEAPSEKQSFGLTQGGEPNGPCAVFVGHA
jgi:hypothetical protein